MILHFPIRKLEWVFNSGLSYIGIYLALNKLTVREALARVLKPFRFGIWYSSIFTPLIILSIVHSGLFNKLNCNRDPRFFWGIIFQHTDPKGPIDFPWRSLDCTTIYFSGHNFFYDLLKDYQKYRSVFDQTLANNYSFTQYTILQSLSLLYLS